MWLAIPGRIMASRWRGLRGRLFIAAPAAGQRMQPTATVTFKSGVQVRAEIVDTPETLERGLMFRSHWGRTKACSSCSSRQASIRSG